VSPDLEEEKEKKSQNDRFSPLVPDGRRSCADGRKGVTDLRAEIAKGGWGERGEERLCKAMAFSIKRLRRHDHDMCGLERGQKNNESRGGFRHGNHNLRPIPSLSQTWRANDGIHLEVIASWRSKRAPVAIEWPTNR